MIKKAGEQTIIQLDHDDIMMLNRNVNRGKNRNIRNKRIRQRRF